MESEQVTGSTPALDAAFDKVGLAATDPEMGARYPDRTHFIAADDPRHAGMATIALFSGDPVALVYPDGREVLLTPEQAKGLAAVGLLVAALLTKFAARRHRAEVIQLPPRVRVEARDRSGLPTAA